MVRNPWLRLEGEPWVAACDRVKVDAFNRSAKAANRLDLSLMPLPYIGRVDAPVVLLNLNPGMPRTDAGKAVHREPGVVDLLRANLRHRVRTHQPFFFLDDRLDIPGCRWWRSKLSRLCEDAGVKAVAANVLCVEWIAYHSRRFAHGRLVLPSQAYSFDLVRRAMRRGSIIVMMRGRKHWTARIPELVDHHALIRIVNRQNPAISPKNCGRGYEGICDRIR